MVDYTYNMPTKIFSGVNESLKIVEHLEKLVAQPRILLVSDSGIIDSGLLKYIEQQLQMNAIYYFVFSDFEPNPKASSVEKGISKIDENNINVILAVGGGSSIDVAKAISFKYTNEGNIFDYEGVNKIKNSTLPLIAVPTTSGTGSEVTGATVLTNDETFYKVSIISDFLYPDIAILDPVLTINCPPAITASTGMDALTHAIESFTSKRAQPISEALALRAITIINDNIKKAYFVGTDLESRRNMLEASMIAGIAFSQSRLGNVHAISHAIGGLFNIPHGIANATLLPYVIKYNLNAFSEKAIQLANAFNIQVKGFDNIEIGKKVLQHLVELNKVLGIPDNIKELGVNIELINQIVEDSMKSGNIVVNPRLTTAKDIENIVLHAYSGEMEGLSK